MNRKILTLTLSCIFSLSSLSTAAFCVETQESPTEHVSISIRPMNEENRRKMKDQREELPLLETVEAARGEKELPNMQQPLGARPAKMGHKKEYYYNNHSSNAIHWVIGASIDGTILELEDGSNWKLSPNYSVINWRVGDPIAITPNHSFLSEYNYYVVNKATGSYVAADLILGPIAFGSYTHWIIGMDYTSGHVYLENGSTWTISSNDLFIFNDWAINDTIILGSNDSWFSCYDNLLINVNMNNYVRARKY